MHTIVMYMHSHAQYFFREKLNFLKYKKFYQMYYLAIIILISTTLSLCDKPKVKFSQAEKIRIFINRIFADIILKISSPSNSVLSLPSDLWPQLRRNDWMYLLYSVVDSARWVSRSGKSAIRLMPKSGYQMSS
jgi:hypothetical protein